jgi:hypothetical protein
MFNESAFSGKHLICDFKQIENKELLKEQVKKYKEEHKEVIAEQMKKYRAENKEKINEQFKIICFIIYMHFYYTFAHLKRPIKIKYND